MTPAQITFDLNLEASFDRDDLVESDANLAAITMIDSFPNWPNPILVLVGPADSGKTHLANIWSERADAISLSPDFALSDIPQENSVLVENIDQTEFDETALFHLANHIRQTGQFLLLTARTMPSTWGIELPDLVSRLRAAATVEIDVPDDDLLRGVLMKLIADRQLQVASPAIEYMLTHMERSLGAANLLVEKLDKASLAEHRKVSRQLAADIITSMSL